MGVEFARKIEKIISRHLLRKEMLIFCEIIIMCVGGCRTAAGLGV